MKTIFTLTKSLNKTYVKDPKKFYSNFQNTHSKFFSSSIGNSNSNTSNSLKHK